MKPKTKLQKKIVKLSNTLSPMTEDQKRWAEQECFDKYFVQSRKSHYCLECGHKWRSDEPKLSASVIGATCPECGEKLKHFDGWERDASIYEYWSILTVVKGYQVVRMFRAHKYLKKKQAVEYYHQEVMQHWIGKDGKITTLSALCQGMGHYYDTWTAGTDLEVRNRSYSHHMRCSIAPFKICPGRRILPIIRRNGYKGYFYDEAPHQFFSAILKHQKAETLLKAGQFDLFKKYIGLEKDTHEAIEEHWGSICIAIRTGYTVKKASDWLDYLGMLNRFGKDTLNAHYVCPDDLKREHDRYVEKVRDINRQQELEEKKKEIEEANQNYVESKGMFFDLHIRADGLEIVPLRSVEEFYIEGERLKHCIFTSDYHKKDDSLIMSARIDGEPVETVEVDLDRLRVKQARGYDNLPTEHHDLIVDAVQQNMNKIAARV